MIGGPIPRHRHRFEFYACMQDGRIVFFDQHKLNDDDSRNAKMAAANTINYNRRFVRASITDHGGLFLDHEVI